MQPSRFLKNLRSQRGDIVMMTIIAIGISTIILLGLSVGIMNMYKLQKSDSLTSEQRDIADQFRSLLSVQGTCRNVFGNQNLAGALNGNVSGLVGQNVRLNGIAPIANLNPAQAPVLNANGLVLTKLEFIPRVPGVAMPSLMNVNLTDMANNPNVSMPMYSGILVIGVQKASNSLFFKDYKDILIPMDVAVIGNQLQSCATYGDEADACNMMKGIWRPLAAQQARCVSPQTCIYGGTYVNAPVAQGGYPNAFTNQMNCLPGFTERQRGTLTYSTSCGKACINNTYHQIVECSICTDALGANVASSVIPPAGSSGTNLDPLEALLESYGGYNMGLGGSILGAVPSVTTTTLPLPSCRPSGFQFDANPPIGSCNNFSTAACCSGTAKLCLSGGGGGMFGFTVHMECL